MNQIKKAIQNTFDINEINHQLLLDRFDLQSAIKRGNEHQSRIYAQHIVWWTMQKIEVEKTK